MRAVWSFWSKPYLAGWTRWYSDWHHWLGWALSLHTASRFYPDTHLVTDDHGATILIDKLQLPFAHVSTQLNEIASEDADWWSLGKIEAYRLQRKPFVHVDADVFLWKRLPVHVEEADVFTQNPEPIVTGETLYTPDEVDRVIGKGWLPKEWAWYKREREPRSECCGVFGGNRTDFIEHYASTALRMIGDPRNQEAMRVLPDKSRHMLLIEQYLLSACVDYHRVQKHSPFFGIEIRHIFPSLDDACDSQRAAEVGFTHLAAGAKRNPRVARDLEARVQTDLPEFFDRSSALRDLAGA